MGFASLGSGSKGNGTIVAAGKCTLLVDCGFTLKQTEQRLARIGMGGGDIDAILVSHEHADHIGGVAALAHKYAIPVYASYGTLKKGLDGVRTIPFDGDVPFRIDDLEINPVRVPHDAREPTQFVIHGQDETIGVLSDLGCITNHVVSQYKGCTHLLLEANHDYDMLMRGDYPPRLKQRVGKDLGHLSNVQAADFLDRVMNDDLNVVIGHVSEQNNHPDRLAEVFSGFHDRLGSLDIASQHGGFDWIGQRPLLRQTSFTEVL